MHYSWDPAKSERTLRSRGFDFAFASLIFGGQTVEHADRRHDYGEPRIIATGVAEGVFLTVVFTDRIGIDDEIERRLISARESTRREIRTYVETTNQEAEPRPRRFLSTREDDG